MALLNRTVDCLEFSKLVREINVHENRIGDEFGERLHPPKKARLSEGFKECLYGPETLILGAGFAACLLDWANSFDVALFSDKSPYS